MLFFNYIKFLKSIYKNFRNKKNNDKSIILVEFYSNLFPLLGVLFLVKALMNVKRSKVLFYHTKITSDYSGVFKILLKYILHFRTLFIYLALGAKPNFCTVNNQVNNIAKKKFLKIIELIHSKDDLLNLTLEGVEVGDLFYDNYLRQNSKHTLEITPEFKKILLQYLNEFYYWHNFFNKHDIKSVVVSHAVYNLAIPLRIAQTKSIASYIASLNFIEYFDSNRKTIFHSEYRNSFKLLSEYEKKNKLLYAKKLLEKKFHGEHNFSELKGYGSNPEVRKNLSLEQLETFGKKETNKKEIFKKNGKPNVLIMAHCFYDAPHAVGKFLFSDFYDWVIHLGKISNETDYNWYIKKHPHSVEKKLNDEVIKKIILQYPKIQLLKDNVTNNEILNDNVSLILTVHGSSAYEFSYNGVPVILASDNSSYRDYNICYQPKDVKDFDNVVKNFKDVTFPFDKNEILRYYYNINLAYWNLIPVEEYNKIFKPRVSQNFKLTNLIQENKLYQHFNATIDTKIFNKKIVEIENFIRNKDYRLFSK